MPKADPEELAKLKAFCTCVVEFLLRQHGPSLRNDYVRVVERTTSLRGVRTLISDVLEWSLDVKGDGLAELDASLSAKALPTLTLMRTRADRKLAAILARGRIASADEYRFIHARLADVEAKLPAADRALAERELAEFGAQRRK